MELELRHLRVLCAIADAGSLGRAAADRARPAALPLGSSAITRRD